MNELMEISAREFLPVKEIKYILGSMMICSGALRSCTVLLPHETARILSQQHGHSKHLSIKAFGKTALQKDGRGILPINVRMALVLPMVPLQLPGFIRSQKI